MNINDSVRPQLTNPTMATKFIETGDTQQPIKDYVSDIALYIYNTFIKNNLLWILILVSIALVLFYRYKTNKKNKEQMQNLDTINENEYLEAKTPNAHLVNFNPLTRQTNGIPVDPLNPNLPRPTPFPSMLNQQYDENSIVGNLYHTNGINHYNNFETNMSNNWQALPNDFLESTSSAIDFSTNQARNNLNTLNDIVDEKNRYMAYEIPVGPDSLENVNTIIPPYHE